MANLNVVTFICAAVGGFLGALIGDAFTKTSSSLGQPTATVALSSDASRCPPPPPCPRCEGSVLPSCPRCDDCPKCDEGEKEGEAQPCPVCPEVDAGQGPTAGSLLNSKSGESSEGHAITHVPAPAPPGSFNSRNFYPLHRSFNRFEHWYDQRREGKGVWKWTQYFPAWERHFAKFVAKSWAGEEVHMAELGIFSGGSLEMWQAVFGPGLRLWGVDIAMMTKQYERDDKSGRTKIFNMDQTNADSWTEFKKQVPKLDILIDDGLHLFKGQKATMDNILDHIAPGGVFMTEDISDGKRPGAKANRNDGPEYEEKYLEYSYQKMRNLHVAGSWVQDTIDSIHYYPYLFVVEKREVPLRPHGSGAPLAAIKHGTLWKPITRGVVQGAHAQ